MIRKALLGEIGFMDEESFPRGYGEENDFCFRALAAGYRTVVADDTYIYHTKSKSVGHTQHVAYSRDASLVLIKKYGLEKYKENVKLTLQNKLL